MGKRLFIGCFVFIAAAVLSTFAWSELIRPPLGENPIKKLWRTITDIQNTITDIQNQIDNIQLVLDSQGVPGPPGPQGEQGPRGPMGSMPSYPDGMENISQVILDELYSSPYTVPDGENLYVMNTRKTFSDVASLYINGNLIARNASNVPQGYDVFFPSLIVGEGEVISASHEEISVIGFLVNASVSALTLHGLNSSHYVVPTGKMLIIGYVMFPIESTIFYLNIDGYDVYSSYSYGRSIHFIVDSGHVLSASHDDVTLNGYLIDN